MAHWQLGQKEQARQWYDRANRLRPEQLAKYLLNTEELRLVRAEADALLGDPAASEPGQAKKP